MQQVRGVLVVALSVEMTTPPPTWVKAAEFERLANQAITEAARKRYADVAACYRSWPPSDDK
jgi:hypothetical protein